MFQSCDPDRSSPDYPVRRPYRLPPDRYGPRRHETPCQTKKPPHRVSGRGVPISRCLVSTMSAGAPILLGTKRRDRNGRNALGGK
jgi:hypothetical protein